MTITLVITCVVWSDDVAEGDETFRPVLGMTVLLSMVKLVSYLQALPAFGFLITMMVSIVDGIKYFIILLFAAIFAFAIVYVDRDQRRHHNYDRPTTTTTTNNNNNKHTTRV